MEIISKIKCFDGWIYRCHHVSALLGSTTMRFAVYEPKNRQSSVPVLFWLSGLTCTDENFTVKSGAFRKASELGIALVIPDTSPRDVGIEGEIGDWTVGAGASFYLNATQEPWARSYRMYDYIVKELPQIIKESFSFIDLCRKSIAGHSMGGHGALMIALKNPGMFKSVSAFAPLTNPSQVDVCQKAFRAYLGDNQETWKEWDSCELISRYAGPDLYLLVDQGTQDVYLNATKVDKLKVSLSRNKDLDSYFRHKRMQLGFQ
eukprot:GHVL01034776.1.p1 GENE.GHVL01034776.1~~GHVL01034776.1.p1  ORF type:complete len:261 (+),score=28.43 GHVL01034776.1:54-836(+)